MSKDILLYYWPTPTGCCGRWAAWAQWPGRRFTSWNIHPSTEPPQDIPYAKQRYRYEISRLLNVLDRQLQQNKNVAGYFYSIADMATWPWTSLWRDMEQSLYDRPALKAWLTELKERPLLGKGRALFDEARIKPQENPTMHKLVFGQST